MRLPIFITTLLTLALFLGGCIHIPAQPPAKPSTLSPTGSGFGISTSTTQIDTSDWQTYTNQEYGFSFRYPREWGYFRHTSSSSISYAGTLIDDPITYFLMGKNENEQELVVSITDFVKSPAKPIDLNYLGGDNPRILLSKKEITEYKKAAKFIRDGLSQGTFSIDYDYPGGGFLIKKDMFSDNNLIEFSRALRVDNFEKLFDGVAANPDRTAVRKKIEELHAGVGTPAELYQIEFFNSIIFTVSLHKLSSN